MTLQTGPIDTCSRCKSNRHVIVGDGPNVCFPCIELLTQTAADPESVSLRMRETMAELHADAVELEDDDNVLSWKWLLQWPVK